MIRLRHPIDPLVDCVFAALLGDPANAALLIDFLNAILRPAQPITQVALLNPYNRRGSKKGKLTIVDVKARDAAGRIYQVEVQVLVEKALKERILYTWSHVFHGQLQKGQPYTRLAPVISIWLIDGHLFPGSEPAHHRFRVLDSDHGVELSSHLSIHTLELPKFKPKLGPDGRPLLDAEGRWLYFFREASTWHTLPAAINTPVMRQAMTVLKGFSNEERDYHAYQARLDWLRVQRTRAEIDRESEQQAQRLKELQEEIRKTEQEKQRAEQGKQRAEQEKQRAEQEQMRLRQLLLDAGIDPDKA